MVSSLTQVMKSGYMAESVGTTYSIIHRSIRTSGIPQAFDFVPCLGSEEFDICWGGVSSLSRIYLLVWWNTHTSFFCPGLWELRSFS